MHSMPCCDSERFHPHLSLDHCMELSLVKVSTSFKHIPNAYNALLGNLIQQALAFNIAFAVIRYTGL